MTRFILSCLTASLFMISTRLDAQAILVPENSTWKYLDDGTNQGTAWREAGFDDATWDSGPAELGYGDGDEATVLSYGPNSSNKYITYYFRHEFIVDDSVSTSYLLLRVLRDDGVVVYLNGSEVCRSNMPTGTITYQTVASSAVGGSDESTFFEYIIPATGLTDTNVIAAEIHQSSVTSSDISFNLELSTTSLPAFRKQPYLLFNGNNGEMTILWQLYQTTPGSLSWGTDTTYAMGNQEVPVFGTDHQYSYTINGLSDATKYCYRVIVGDDTVAGDFVTSPAPTATSVTFYAYGDTRTYPNVHDSVAEGMIQDFADEPGHQSLAIMSADLVSDGNSETIWDDQFFSPDYDHLQQLLRTLPLVSCKGNHEGTGQLFKKYYPFPYFISSSFYWSFDYGPVHVCVVDQYTTYTVGSAQYDWIVADLAGSSKPWKLILLHEPGWSAGGGHQNNTTVQNVIQPLCLDYGVQFVINGHNHYYSRAEVDGVEHLTVGGGGAPLHTPNPSYPNIVACSSSHHFTRIDINEDTLQFTAVKADGTIIESFTCHNYREWTGAEDNDWNNPANWSTGAVPEIGWDVVVPGQLSNPPEISGITTCRNLRIETGATLYVLDGGILNVNGICSNDGTLVIMDGGTVNQGQ